MSMVGLVVFAIIVLAACYTTCCLHQGEGRKNVLPEIEKAKLL
ncbi:hypothetical protein VSS37_07515 [Candidatus Thiothrix sp. Deng01]|uniref:Uncharacterized protein n=1 Tax=Candidatus Thiothrix phosphatis TaxID=3112415 RepID=A0ABU6CVH7_9GAMM|nr:hypothetical protein [Candidatus Thiothrix sp. Deng01]MEB4590821.1 hypothetical protein [Candidatus Thiothrix sp. Deng01]